MSIVRVKPPANVLLADSERYIDEHAFANAVSESIAGVDAIDDALPERDCDEHTITNSVSQFVTDADPVDNTNPMA